MDAFTLSLGIAAVAVALAGTVGLAVDLAIDDEDEGLDALFADAQIEAANAGGLTSGDLHNEIGGSESHGEIDGTPIDAGRL